MAYTFFPRSKAEIIKKTSKSAEKAAEIVSLFDFLKKKYKQVDTPINIDEAKLSLVNVSRELQGLVEIKDIAKAAELKSVKINKINTKVIPCKTIRDKQFIAYSSRLKKINKYEKNTLIKIIKILRVYKKNIILKKTNYDFKTIKKTLLSVGANKVDYVEIINLKTLKKPKGNKFNLFFAFYIGKIRFIDNF